MKTTFFTELQKLQLKQISIAVIFDDNGNATVSILPKSDAKDKAKNLIPLSISGDVADIDANFFEKLTEPLEKTAPFFTNIEEYEKKMEKQRQNTQEEKAKKDKIKNLEEKLKKIVDAKDFEPKESKPKVLKLVKDLQELDEKNTLATKWKFEIQSLTEATLF